MMYLYYKKPFWKNYTFIRLNNYIEIFLYPDEHLIYILFIPNKITLYSKTEIRDDRLRFHYTVVKNIN